MSCPPAPRTARNEPGNSLADGARRTRAALGGEGGLGVADGLPALLATLTVLLTLLPGCLPERRPSAAATAVEAPDEDVGQADVADAGSPKDAGVDAGTQVDPTDTHVAVGCTLDSQCASLSTNPCHQVSCDKASGYCKIALRPDGSKCGVDTPCGKNLTCKAGACKYEPVDCADNNPCTVDACLPGSGCSHVPVSDDDALPCNDGNPCTPKDFCKEGKCYGPPSHPSQHCPKGDNPCVLPACEVQKGCYLLPKEASETCDDGNKCTEKDVCAGGQCVGKPVVCADVDGDPCTLPGCLPGDGEKNGCQPEVAVPGVVCDDANPCTVNDHCATVSGGDPTKLFCKGTLDPCDDADPCTDDSCDNQGKGCQHKGAADDTPCGDGKACLSGGKCAAGKCAGAGPTNCDDGNACTLDGCEEGAGGCVHVALAATATCDDGNPCTQGDVCNATAACAGVEACDDGNACTKDTCAATGCQSTFVSNGTPCDGGGKCWGGNCQISKCPNTVCDFNEDPTSCAADCPAGGGLCDPKDDACMGKCQGEQCKTDDAACAQTPGCPAMVGCMSKATDDNARLQCLVAAGASGSGAFFALNRCLKSKCEKNAWWGKVCAAGPTLNACVEVCGVHACYSEHISCFGDADCKALSDCSDKCASGDQACVKTCQSAACKADCKAGDGTCATSCESEAVFAQNPTVLAHDKLVKCRQINCF